jgi:glycosyltransferase involved in cell wall biosynthesis
MKKISVVLTTHNEAKNIERCLDSVKDFADEIVVVDGESTDNTVELAKKYKAKVISTTNKVNFHINKQMAMDAATGDLVLQLDADEVIDETLAAFIKKVAHSDANSEYAQISAWWIKRKNWFMGKFLKKGGQYPDPAIRLYWKGRARLPQKDVHEFMQVDGQIGWADGDMLHYGNPTFADYLRKFNTYTSFKAQQLAEDGVKISLANTFKFLIWLPFSTWFLIFFRHKGFVDGVAGFTFALFSGFHHFIAYLKLWEIYAQR